MSKFKFLAAAMMALAITGCSTTTSYINAGDTESNIVAGLSYADFKQAAWISFLTCLESVRPYTRLNASRALP